MKSIKILLIGLMLGISVGCETIQALTGNQMEVPTIPKPNVETYVVNDENVCLSKEDASEFFEYVYTLEVTMEQLREQ